MDEEENETTGRSDVGDGRDPAAAWTPTTETAPTTETVPSVVAGPALPPDVPTPPAPWESPMPLSMPSFAQSSAGPTDGLLDPPGGPSSGGTPPELPWGGGGPGDYGHVPPPPPEPHHGGRNVLAVAAVAALLAGGLGAGLGVAFGSGSGSGPTSTTVPVVPSPGRSTQASSGPSESTAAIAKAVQPGIVDINTTVASPAAQGQEQAAGTGMIITSSGEVLTNNHVVENATKITVSIQGHSGTYAASVIGVDPTKDVALLQIEGYSGSLPTVSLGNSSSVAVGNSVVAMGNAQGLGGQPTTVTGMVSALGRTITAGDQTSATVSETLHGLIETDAPIQPGDSGGPLINAHAQVVGMDTAALSGTDTSATLGFAIPINQARTIAQEMEKGQAVNGIILGESPFLGIYGSVSSAFGSSGFGSSTGTGTGTSAGTTPAGIGLSDVAIGGPAQAAGLVAGDTITKIDSTTTTTFAALQKVVAAQKPGNQISVSYVDTSGATHSATVTLGGIPK
ncbi:MAG: hypothetical protein JWO62_3173 [Acidimicrobiaceae bacterium]|jgi:S1-C subfamily serine protease|nr:hypothetical protein [Acidimicrobiaceae bacterium]